MHTPMWTLKHQVLWSCDTRAQDSFFLFKSTQCFQNMLFFYQFMHPSESILGTPKNFTAFTLQVNTIFFSTKTCVMTNESFQRKVGSYFFSKACWLLNQKIFFVVFFCFCLFVFFSSFLFFQKIKKKQFVTGARWIPEITLYLKRRVNDSTQDLHTYIFSRFGHIIVK